MVLKKVDNRLRILIENGVQTRHRSLFVVVGDKGRDQVVILHHMLSKAAVKARPSVLWCYKKELGFSSHRKKRMKQLQKKIKSGTLDMNKDDPFELFVSSTNIRYCYYKETHKILGNTYGMCVLQDFEALTPNLLARTVETVEGGGIVVILLRTMSSLKQLYTMSMDVHARYRTESHQDVVGRFNERFILSLSSCKSCMVIDDQLNILPLTSHSLNIKAVPPKPKEESLTPSEVELKELKDSLQDTQPVGSLINCCRTLDQAKALLKFIEAISEKTLRTTVSLTAARGRGKSAAIGLALASAVAFGYSNMFVTSPSPENLHTLFEFVFKGFDALDYQEHIDYELVQSTNPEFNKAVVRINIFRDHRQTIQYIHPSDAHKLGQAELLCIDEAAAIPLPLVKNLLGPYLVFMSSTINGYEGTGRSLSLKLLQQLRQQSVPQGVTSTKTAEAGGATTAVMGRMLSEVTLEESIRYAPGDAVEKWLNKLLCLDATVAQNITGGCPLPESCELYYVNRDTLFSYHKASEVFLQRLMALYVASHYKNTPDDLQLLSDAPAHHIFCLLGPVDPSSPALPEVYCVLQVCLEGDISKSTIMSSLSRGKRASGDLIPWTVSQQFNDHEFASLSGGRVVRIATHPDVQGMGYGRKALSSLVQYYEGKIPNLSENGQTETSHLGIPTESEADNLLAESITPRANLPPLLLKLGERPAERLDYLGVSYGLTAQLLRFWKRSCFVPVYLRQTANDLTGEHSCIMLRILGEIDAEQSDDWLKAYTVDFRRRFLSLLSFQFRSFPASLGLSILQDKSLKDHNQVLSRAELDFTLTNYDMKRLDMYSRNMVDHHLIMDLVPAVARFYFLRKLDISLSAIQSAILLGVGLQHKTFDQLEKELELPVGQLLGLFNRITRKVVQHLNSVVEAAIEGEIVKQKDVHMEPLAKSLNQDLEEAAKEMEVKQKKELEKLKLVDFSEYAISGKEDDWQEALSGKGTHNLVSIPSSKRKSLVGDLSHS
ncbi:predicted protein [Nematostella vectensis]|uniref:RNA cytidine acetyltransferase n=1 Tax=Nematostella vectensis TaxID=45351 RepID=A7RGZ2_NEMVE|nr:predicted protein [Nematostella vectensis]|eukprot:XP_001641322.1 predicted protein [Nematostella vectensis]